MKLDEFITFVCKTALDQNPDAQEIRFQVSVGTDMTVHAAKITVSGKPFPLVGVQLGQGPYTLDFPIRIAGRDSDTTTAR